jgi:transcriptional regulator of acetoin/glycerol metabolism
MTRSVKAVNVATLAKAAADRIRTVLKEARGARGDAARRLGIDRTTLYRLMRKYGITGTE